MDNPPDKSSTALSRQTAHVLDRLFQIPGSHRRVGLDPLIGLIPGVGDALSAALGSIIVLEAMRSKVPRLLLLRMAGNLGLNACVGAIPLAGDLFSFWFQSNSRNYALLRAWQSGERKIPPGAQTKWVALGCLLLAGVAAFAVWAMVALWKWITT